MRHIMKIHPGHRGRVSKVRCPGPGRSCGLTCSIIEAEVHTVVDDHQGALGVALGIVGALAVADQGQGVLHYVVLDGRSLRGILAPGRAWVRVGFSGQRYLPPLSKLVPSLPGNINALHGAPLFSTGIREPIVSGMSWAVQNHLSLALLIITAL